MEVVVGGFTLDDTVTLDNRVLRKAPGGNVLYSGVGARMAGAETGLVGPVGFDYPGEYLDILTRAGFDLAGVKRLEAPSIHMWALHEGLNRRQLIYWLDSGTNGQLDPHPEHFPDHYLKAEGVHIAALPLSTQEAIAGVYDRDRTAVTLDVVCIPGHIEVDRERLERLLGRVTAFLPSREEVANIWGVEPSPATCRLLGQFGPEVVGIKMGDQGSMVWSRGTGETSIVPVHRTTAVDTTGAGDAYCGGFSAAYARTRNPLEAAVIGTVAASFVIEDFGGLHALTASRDSFRERLSEVGSRLRTL